MDTGVVILLTFGFGVLALIVIPEVVDRKKIKKVVEIVKGIDEKVF